MSSLPSSFPAKRGGHNPEIQKIMVRRSSALHEVTKKGIYGDIQRIIDSNPSSIDDVDQFGQTALHIAAFEGYLDIVELLISNGASITLQDKNGWAPLHCAATNGHLDICQRLIIEGADPNAQVCQNNFTVNRALQRSPASPNFRDVLSLATRLLSAFQMNL